MMASITTGPISTSLLVGAQGSITVIPAEAELTRLNYFNGRLMHAEDLQAEQDYLRALVRLSNRAGGAGVVDGFDAVLSADQGSIMVRPGLALDGDGHALLLPAALTLDIGTLINAGQKAASRSAIPGRSDFKACAPALVSATPPVTDVPGLYLLTVGFAEVTCGEELAQGDPCADPCSGSAHARYVIEGIIFRAVPLDLALPDIKILSLEEKHLRSRVASAYFAREASMVQSLISGAGLRAETWCFGAAPAAGREVPLAVFLRSGNATPFLDAWTARRERIEPPPRRYWAWRMAMRPWDAYVAQILQFQCQLRDLLTGAGATSMGLDPCGAERKAINNTLALFKDLDQSIAGLSAVKAVKANLLAAWTRSPTAWGELVDTGIIELPPAGYLPVDNESGEAVEPQVRRALGQGLDLRFCIVRPDYVPYALEERQHMDRISLLHGLERPDEKPEVDILVPNGIPEEGGCIQPQLDRVMFCRRRAERSFKGIDHALPAPSRFYELYVVNVGTSIGDAWVLASLADDDGKFNAVPVGRVGFQGDNGVSLSDPEDVREQWVSIASGPIRYSAIVSRDTLKTRNAARLSSLLGALGSALPADKRVLLDLPDAPPLQVPDSADGFILLITETSIAAPPPPLPSEKALGSLAMATLARAQADLDAGVEETNPNDGPRIREYLANYNLPGGYDWCAAALGTWLREAAAATGLPAPIKGSPGALVTKGQFQKAGLWIAKDTLTKHTVQPGMVPIWTRGDPAKGQGHIGIIAAVHEVNGKPVFSSIEGNHESKVALVLHTLDEDRLLGMGILPGTKAEPKAPASWAASTELNLPARLAGARAGKEFISSTVGSSYVDREQAIFIELSWGNVPPFLRVTVQGVRTVGISRPSTPYSSPIPIADVPCRKLSIHALSIDLMATRPKSAERLRSVKSTAKRTAASFTPISRASSILVTTTAASQQSAQNHSSSKLGLQTPRMRRRCITLRARRTCAVASGARTRTRTPRSSHGGSTFI